MTNKQVTFKHPEFDITISGDSAQAIVKEYKDLLKDLQEALGQKQQPIRTTSITGSKPKSQQIQGGLKADIVTAVNEGFFDQKRTLTDLKTNLAKKGIIKPLTSLSGPMKELVRDKVLERDLQTIGNKKVWFYSKHG